MAKIVKGDTVRFTVQFRDWDGNPARPESVTFRVYNQKWETIYETLLGDNQDLGFGAFYFDYTLNELGLINAEFVGQLQGTPALKRIQIPVSMV